MKHRRRGEERGEKKNSDRKYETKYVTLNIEIPFMKCSVGRGRDENTSEEQTGEGKKDISRVEGLRHGAL